jgi:hypothetical protein
MYMKKIPLNGKYGKGEFALVDDEDYEELMQHRWLGTKKGYAVSFKSKRNKNTATYIHRLIMNAPKHLVVDHINHDKLDNRRSNLRICTNGQNRANTKKTSGASKFKGVFFNKGAGRPYAKIYCNYEQIYIGTFDTELEAAAAYNTKALELFGDFAYLNKI